ncbi:MAG: SMC-Scp complex subunit ScpB [Omnitrophica WOR_2 bacterium GWF2_38_59]|nr:MAG: SMC-Scp complex subunit ScpB [Omnitrophica WOR_2 bacterium GWA2_37_7]OGX22204.1 MAG: SMC-Scp complex subunit ScpB [Omnitrophica WOR_2 bacterium GWF2_38_59]OGX46823.1 MAG: SMC-Scp complex subunit ScpB [Omnitrophica WOR_2 bacterium RIFOXYA2_FULL_38_17]OGX51623.1 MAG: SMC-Scp complex subunit ScpB [Omnitrophica WOR_2 bacterium RIFOXYA12_FULL_38_10]OGX58781.1 MAG: SMC-Scp complex subunit ScpB [Omnitrophica WOR_2 bacterium RIFOXYC2_FULL_38_12]OGX59664.1 MAG: SMC-Scp complex subunit ScpB [Omn
MEDSFVEKKEEQLNGAVDNLADEGQGVSEQIEDDQRAQDQGLDGIVEEFQHGNEGAVAEQDSGQSTKGDISENEGVPDEESFDKEMMDQAKEIEEINKAAEKEEDIDEDQPQEEDSFEEHNIADCGDDITTHIKGVLEALLFVNERPITLEQIKKVLDTVSGAEIKNAISMLASEYAEKKSGITIKEIAGGYQMFSNSTYASYIKSFYKTKHKEKLSKPALESLAIIAYKQPVSRSDIELIRGVNSDGVVAHLFNKELIKIVGRKDVPGRPYLYGTTKQFLEYFGLKSMDTLPKLEEFPSLMAEKDDNSTKVVEEDVIATVPREESSADPANVESMEDADNVVIRSEDEEVETERVESLDENDRERG